MDLMNKTNKTLIGLGTQNRRNIKVKLHKLSIKNKSHLLVIFCKIVSGIINSDKFSMQMRNKVEGSMNCSGKAILS